MFLPLLEIKESVDEEESGEGDFLGGGDGKDKIEDDSDLKIGVMGFVSSSEVVRSMSRLGVEEVGREVDADVIMEVLIFLYYLFCKFFLFGVSLFCWKFF